MIGGMSSKRQDVLLARLGLIQFILARWFINQELDRRTQISWSNAAALFVADWNNYYSGA